VQAEALLHDLQQRAAASALEARKLRAQLRARLARLEEAQRKLRAMLP
jgi:hypothetical protein